jgi:aspartate/glutamate racemase/prolyl-tRNA editing enzyme YbaK/EbsC (Cys-tRNA(Pro) deacylase)
MPDRPPVLGGEPPPPSVARTAAFLSERGVWHLLGRNREARSCRDAAHKRLRLGERGIPLWDELKSFFGVARRADGHRQHLVVHCRGDRTIDLARVATAVGSAAEPERLEGAALERLGMAYGLVNPFEPWAFDGQLLAMPVLQVFDRDLLTPLGVPGTVMTNAGDLTWSVEFHAKELARSLDHAIVADVSIEDPREPPRPKWAVEPTTFGIVTGNGPDSGMLLWRSINRAVREALGEDSRGDFAMPRVLIQSLPEMGLTMELDHRHASAWPPLRSATAELCRDGANVVAIACNTTPHFAPELARICKEYGATFLSMPEVVGAWLRRNGIEQIALLGVKTVAELGPWSPYREPLEGIEVHVPNAATMARIHALAYRVKSEGPSHKGLTRLRDILHEEVRADVIVLALTELSLLLEVQKRPQRSDRLIVDTVELYASALAERYVGASIREPSPSVTSGTLEQGIDHIPQRYVV